MGMRKASTTSLLRRAAISVRVQNASFEEGRVGGGQGLKERVGDDQTLLTSFLSLLLFPLRPGRHTSYAE